MQAFENVNATALTHKIKISADNRNMKNKSKTGDNMKKIIIGLALGAVAGAYVMRKLDDNQIPERIMQQAHEKLGGKD